MEHVGYDNSTTPDARATLTAIAARLSPTLGAAPLLSHWAGLRPVTPDGLPILGHDSAVPGVLYACGHGRNGILLAPITGETIGAMAVGESSAFDLAPFSIDRYAGSA
jgi:glycine oxidase